MYIYISALNIEWLMFYGDYIDHDITTPAGPRVEKSEPVRCLFGGQRCGKVRRGN